MAKQQRLIDANARLEEIKLAHCTNCENYGGVRCRACWVDDAMSLIEDAPTVDAVEVTRCGACKEWTEIAETGGAGYCNHPCWTIANEQPPIVQFADFCSYGERKDDEEDG